VQDTKFFKKKPTKKAASTDSFLCIIIAPII